MQVRVCQALFAPLLEQNLDVRFAGRLGGCRGSVRKVAGQPKRTHGSAGG